MSNKKGVLVVPHADDEVLFGFSQLKKVEYVVRVFESDFGRDKEFIEVCKRYKVKPILLPMREVDFYYLGNDEVKKFIAEYLGAFKDEYIFTIYSSGTYWNEDHALVESCFFGPSFIEKLSGKDMKEKREVMEKYYPDERKRLWERNDDAEYWNWIVNERVVEYFRWIE